MRDYLESIQNLLETPMGYLIVAALIAQLIYRKRKIKILMKDFKKVLIELQVSIIDFEPLTLGKVIKVKNEFLKLRQHGRHGFSLSIYRTEEEANKTVFILPQFKTSTTFYPNIGEARFYFRTTSELPTSKKIMQLANELKAASKI